MYVDLLGKVREVRARTGHRNPGGEGEGRTLTFPVLWVYSLNPERDLGGESTTQFKGEVVTAQASSCFMHPLCHTHMCYVGASRWLEGAIFYSAQNLALWPFVMLTGMSASCKIIGAEGGGSKEEGSQVKDWESRGVDHCLRAFQTQIYSSAPSLGESQFPITPVPSYLICPCGLLGCIYTCRHSHIDITKVNCVCVCVLCFLRQSFSYVTLTVLEFHI